MRVLLLNIWIFLLIASTVTAGLSDFDITALREKLSQERGRVDGNTSVTTKEIRYRITIKSRSFKALNNVEVKYRVFYNDLQPGETDDGVLQFKSGSEKFPLLGANGTVTVNTSPFSLTTEQLDGNWVYYSGAKRKSADRVVGIWIRIYADGAMSQEYCNPSTLSNKADWKD